MTLLSGRRASRPAGPKPPRRLLAERYTHRSGALDASARQGRLIGAEERYRHERGGGPFGSTSLKIDE